MLDLLAFIVGFIIVFVVYNWIKFISRFEIGEIMLLIYLVISLTHDFLDLLLKVLK